MTSLKNCAFLVAALVCLACETNAQEWPNRPVNVIVPFAAGGSTDVAARVVSQFLSKSLGQQFVVANRTGANGNIGIEAAVKSAPDGYTILIAPDAVVANPHIYPVDYDVLKDLVPVIQLGRQPIVIAAHPSLGVKTLSELAELAKKQPGLRYGTGSGVGSTQHLATAWFAKIAGVDMTQVPYRGGGQAINDLIAGHIGLGTLGSTPLIPHYRAGTILLLAQTTATRSKALPDVPTFQEAGAKGLVLDQWLGVFVPAGTPPAIVAKLNQEIEKSLSDPAVMDNFEKSALDRTGGSPTDFERLVKSEFEKYRSLYKELNIKVN